MHILTDLKRFLEAAPTSWHAVKEIGNRLSIRDFIPLDEEERWELQPGKKYFAIRGGSLCAFSLPQKKMSRALLFAAHTDSPALKLKPNPIVHTANMTQFGVEVYGGPLLSSWLNRELMLAGRVVVTDAAGTPHEKLVLLDDALFLIPQLAIHLDREVNEKGLLLNKQEHLSPIVGLAQEPLPAIEVLLRRHHSFHSLLSFELFLVPHQSAKFIGLQQEMIASYRLDNLASVHAALSAFGHLEAPAQDTLQMLCLWDHEEIGSVTKEGATSPFVSDLFERIGYAFQMDTEEKILLKNHSLCVSVDMAHAFNPNYAKKYEPQHQPLLGEGIVIKYNANQKYASNALSAAVIIRACQHLNLPYQSYVNRSDIPSGTTVGPLFAQAMGINTVDIGCPELSMHSIREVMACKDYLHLVQLLTYLLEESTT